ncbi:MAG: Fe-S-cluster-containing hydrogenase subunit [Planctomycetota bacterium]|nr:Fe-S-cluster-containing hydrogenase subunit [Planctomycetota bacterium]
MTSERVGEDSGPRGRELWRSIDELADTAEFRDFLVREFPGYAPETLDLNTRRQFLRVMAASLGLAGLTGCAVQPPEQIVPYVEQPERLVPGKPLYFASALALGGYATGVLVESHMGRPTKIEGNPDHPASLGATDTFTQAAILDLYDPDRSQSVIHNGRVSTWDNFLAVLVAAMDEHKLTRGQGIRLLSGVVTSPTLIAQIQGLLSAYPEARWHIHEPAGVGADRDGAVLAFGEKLESVHHLEKADVIVSLDADFLAWGPSRLNDARGFARRRETVSDPRGMNRLHVVECTPSITGSMADHRLAVPGREVASVARGLAERLLDKNAVLAPEYSDWIVRVAADLQAHRGTSLVLAGEPQPAEVHALAHAMNHLLGNNGSTIDYIEPVAAVPAGSDHSLAALTREMDSGRVKMLIILGANPVYDAPADLGMAERLLKVPLSIHQGIYADETATRCHWHIPEAHPLESWGDVRAFDGSATIQQPLLSPLYGGKSSIELLAALRGSMGSGSRDLVREHWREAMPGDFEAVWRAAVHDGIVPGSASKPRPATSRPLADILGTVAKPAKATGLELAFRPDPTVWDGRFANNGWLQELPKPPTTLTWDNAALIAPATAERLHLTNEQIVVMNYRGRTLRAAVWIQPMHAEDSVTLHLGYGRSHAGRVGTGQGFNAYRLRTSEAPWQGDGLELRATGDLYRLATTQIHHNMAGRDLVRSANVAMFVADPSFAKDHENPATHGLSLFPSHSYDGHKWGMVINLNTCIGCNACMTGCQSENNIPVVGKDQVLAGREMHWIRVDRYYEGPKDNPSAVYHQPVPCMHCETAPCEVVCPVNATVHDAEGLNAMVYNRCVGTRYCSNNCPYKVRRFNFFQYSDQTTESLKLLNNPDVTVRTRGVMEKCTYCVQRIVKGRIEAEQEGRPLRDGEVVTACQSACPTRAIVFGDLNDSTSAVAKAKADPRNYALLAELNTRPRTTYLAKLTNPVADESNGG